MATSRFHLFLLTGLLAVTGAAQNVRWQPAGGTLARGQTSDLVLIFDNCEPEGEITLPALPTLKLGAPQRGQQTSSNIINGRVSTNRLVYFSYPALPLNDEPVVIPAFTVKTDEGDIPVAAVRFEIREATVGDTSIPVSQVAQSDLRVGTGPLWAGQVVPVEYTLDVSARFRANLGGTPEWEPAPLMVEEWPEPTRSTTGTGGAARNLLQYSTRGYIKNPGTYAIPSVQQLVNIGIPSAGLFQSLRAEQYAITSDSPQITVQPLPSPAPADFAGAVGQFVLTSKVVPENAEVGEPVTWTLQLEGTGNWPEISGLPERQASRSFRVVQPDARRELPEDKLFEGTITEDVVLIPTQAGDFSLGPVTWTYFDPQTGKYQTIRAPETVLQVTPAAHAPPNTGAPQPGSGLPTHLAPAINSAPAPESPTAIPLEVLPGAGTSLTPLDRSQIVRTAIILVSLFPLLWLWLSWRQARRLDPGKPARLARRRLLTLLAKIDQTPENLRGPLLMQWQKDSACLWRSSHAAPVPQLFASDASWAQLWREADRALFADEAKLPADWVSRAQRALAQKRAPRFPVLSVLAPRHLFPIIALLLWFSTPADSFAQGDKAYRSGEFEQAESTWRDAVKINPGDWVAHHNLALALAQQNRWNEAGAHAAVAFVQNPRHPSTRWHLGYTLERAGYTPPILGTFLTPQWPQQIARLASPAEWQWLFMIGVLAGMLSLALILLKAYGIKVPLWKFLSWTGGLSAVAIMASAMFSLQVWSTAAHADTALTWESGELRSIPTDLDGEQQMTPLAAGSLCRVEKAFLGWRQVSFPNGQTGWVRQEALVPLYQ